MPKGKGASCPSCNKQTFHEEGSYRKCSDCGFIGWGWHQQVKEMGKGKGWKCPNCSNQTLHKIITLGNGDIVRRCGTCDFSAIEPAQQAV
jgi:uncharacterized Zn finger protein